VRIVYVMETETNITKTADYDSDLPTYDVTVAGVVVGQVMRVWLRCGGTQWVHTFGLTGIGPSGRSRATAVRNLVQAAQARGLVA
jgi:hypothetical protein